MEKTVEECAHEVVLKNSTYKVNYLDRYFIINTIAAIG